MEKITEQITQFLSCEYRVIPPQRDAGKVMESYHAAKVVGESEGFIPVILVPGQELADRMEKAKSPQYYLQEYQKHRGTDILNGYLDEIKACLKRQGESLEDVIDTVERGQQIDEFIGFVPDDWDETAEVILAKVPTTKPWEVFAWVPMGGWNECPPTEYIMAVMRHWYESCGFCPVVICEDMIEGIAERKPQTPKEAVALGTEHYAFCPDLIEQCCSDESIGQWADTLMKSSIWFFWWD